MSNSNGSKLIPFGRYRGQPVEVLEKDPEYLNWLTNQDWFRTGHASLYQVIINNFTEPCDTPEHNQMQARFLDEQFRLRLVSLAVENFKTNQWWSGCWTVDTPLPVPEFECDGADVYMRIGLIDSAAREKTSFGVGIEIKPSVGDDFPSVMRQMKKSKSKILFLRNYTGTGISEQDFVEMFKSQKILVIFERDIL